MNSSLSALVSPLIKRSQLAVVSFGPIAVQLLKCIQGIHERRHVVVDVKEDNFMLSCDNGKGSTIEAKLASRIRLLDLALVQPWASMDGHRTNDGGKGLAGTPLYASLNVHAGETVSRRDDLEALGYVMAELIIKIVSGNASLQLPWSEGQSDEEIGNLKAAQVNRPNSTFYKQLGTASKPLMEYLTIVQGYSFKKTPDYEELANLLSKIKLDRKIATTPLKKTPTTATTGDASRKRSKRFSTSPVPASMTPGRTTRSRAQARTPQADDDDSDHCYDIPHKMAREDDSMEIEKIPLAQPYAAGIAVGEESSDNDMMDWELIPDENAAPEADAKQKAIQGLTVIVQSGPARGSAVNLIQGQSDSIIVGRNPTSKNGSGIFTLPGDAQVEDNHAKLELWTTKKLVAVVVTDLKTSSGTIYNHEKIRTNMKVFSGDVIHLGGTSLKIVALDPGKVTSPPSTTVSSTLSKRKAPRRKETERQPQEIIEIESSDEEVAAPSKPAIKRHGLKIKVIVGPHASETFEIEQGVSDTIIVGRKPAGKGSTVVLSKDSLLQASHLKLKLYSYARKHFGLIVESSGPAKINGDDVKKTGLASVNDCIKAGNSVLKILGPL